MNQNISLDIKGMTCASCVGRIEKTLKKNEGVISASVNLATEKAKIVYEPSKLDVQSLIALISTAGYEAKQTETNGGFSQKEELHKEKIVLICSILLTIPLVMPMLFEPMGYHFMLSPWLQLIFATPIQFFIGARFYKSAWSALKAKTGNMEMLVAIGTTAAYLLSLYLLLKNLNHLNHNAPHLYFEGSAVIITLVLVGKYLEKKSKATNFCCHQGPSGTPTCEGSNFTGWQRV